MTDETIRTRWCVTVSTDIFFETRQFMRFHPDIKSFYKEINNPIFWSLVNDEVVEVFFDDDVHAALFRLRFG